MRVTGTFAVLEFDPVDWRPEVETGLPTRHVRMVKQYDGAVAGRSITQFSSSFDPERGIGTYVALESFEGSLDGRAGTFNYVHSAGTDGTSPDRLDEFLRIVPFSGTGELEGITGSGSIRIDADGTHHVTFDYELSSGGS